MKRAFLYILFFVSFCSTSFSQTAGAFSRMGFGARGMGMGNALTAVGSGEVSAYYNPALAAFADQRYVDATVGLLSLDRYLNFLSYTQSIQPQGGISVGIINAGTRNIDGRDNDGYHTENYSTTENQFFLAFANRVADAVSIGVGVKVYYSKLFDKVSTTTVGFDAGGYFQITQDLSLGVAIKDLGSKYKWDTSPIYGTDGRQTTDQFPSLRRIGLAYELFSKKMILSAEYENSSAGVSLFRFGGEYSIVQSFSIRTGLDRWDTGDNAAGAKPSFGFTVKNAFDQWTPILNYAFVIEPFSPHGMHIISLTVSF